MMRFVSGDVPGVLFVFVELWRSLLLRYINLSCIGKSTMDDVGEEIWMTFETYGCAVLLFYYAAHGISCSAFFWVFFQAHGSTT